MENTQKEKDSSWFGDLNFRSLGIIAAIALFTGAGGGAGMVGMKGVQAAGGLSEEKADVKYLSNAEAQRLILNRDRQMEDLKRELKTEIEKTLKKGEFDIWQKNWDERQKYFDEKLDRILEK